MGSRYVARYPRASCLRRLLGCQEYSTIFVASAPAQNGWPGVNELDARDKVDGNLIERAQSAQQLAVQIHLYPVGSGWVSPDPEHIPPPRSKPLRTQTTQQLCERSRGRCTNLVRRDRACKGKRLHMRFGVEVDGWPSPPTPDQRACDQASGAACHRIAYSLRPSSWVLTPVTPRDLRCEVSGPRSYHGAAQGVCHDTNDRATWRRCGLRTDRRGRTARKYNEDGNDETV